MAPSERIVAGVKVPDSPLLTNGLKYLRERTPDVLFNHCVRSWLFGCIIAPQVPTFAGVDLEAAAMAALFHDIGLGEELATDIVSQDKRFEVDGANAAVAFIKRETSDGEWDKHRRQLVWDSIALHSTPSIALHKEIEVQAALSGIFTDLTGPVAGQASGLVSPAQWDEIVKEYPRGDIKRVAIETLCRACKKKPETAHDNFLRDFGEKYVEGYSAVGHRIIDAVENAPA